MNRRQKAVLVGMILGDAYLQKTGKQNARIRLEHSEKQKDYLEWKAAFFPEFFQGKPSFLKRFNPVYKKEYSYVRWQSNSSPEIGKFQKIFYIDGKKIIPKELSELLTDPLSLAVWFGDDGYYYPRDRMAYIYLAKYSDAELALLLDVLQKNFNLSPNIKTKKGNNKVLVFPVKETEKLLNPVSTEV